MNITEEIFAAAKQLSPALQREALEFVHFLADRQQPLDPRSPEFTSELIAAFAEAKANALKSAPLRG